MHVEGRRKRSVKLNKSENGRDKSVGARKIFGGNEFNQAHETDAAPLPSVAALNLKPLNRSLTFLEPVAAFRRGRDIVAARSPRGRGAHAPLDYDAALEIAADEYPDRSRHAADVEGPIGRALRLTWLFFIGRATKEQD
jgi:hypothetical protein